MFAGLIRRSMFVSDRSFFMRDPARSLYSTAAYYLSIMTVNAAVTIINATFLVLLMYGMIGESFLLYALRHDDSVCCSAVSFVRGVLVQTSHRK